MLHSSLPDAYDDPVSHQPQPPPAPPDPVGQACDGSQEGCGRPSPHRQPGCGPWGLRSRIPHQRRNTGTGRPETPPREDAAGGARTIRMSPLRRSVGTCPGKCTPDRAAGRCEKPGISSS